MLVRWLWSFTNKLETEEEAFYSYGTFVEYLRGG
jgi:hypothetical protein